MGISFSNVVKTYAALPNPSLILLNSVRVEAQGQNLREMATVYA
jgi:hypothetical protein